MNIEMIALCVILAGVLLLIGIYLGGIENVKQWLVLATANAEKELGSGTGTLKLRQVYDLFVTRFPWVARFLSFKRFSVMVDDALKTMKNLLASNKAVQEIVLGDTEKAGAENNER